MRQGPLLLVLIGLASAVAWVHAGDERPRDSADARHAIAAYTVHLTEFRLHQSGDPSLTARDIIRSFQDKSRDGSLDLVRTIRFAAMVDRQSVAHFGEQKVVTIGTHAADHRPQDQPVQLRDLGTIARIRLHRSDNHLLLELQCESSSMPESDEADSRVLSIRRCSLEAMLPISLESPVLIGGTSEDPSSYLLASIEPR